MNKEVPIDDNVGVHLHEVSACLNDDEGSMRRTPVLLLDHQCRVDEQATLSGVLQNSCNLGIESSHDEHLQQVGCEGPASAEDYQRKKRGQLSRQKSRSTLSELKRVLSRK